MTDEMPGRFVKPCNCPKPKDAVEKLRRGNFCDGFAARFGTQQRFVRKHAHVRILLMVTRRGSFSTISKEKSRILLDRKESPFPVRITGAKHVVSPLMGLWRECPLHRRRCKVKAADSLRHGFRVPHQSAMKAAIASVVFFRSGKYARSSKACAPSPEGP